MAGCGTGRWRAYWPVCALVLALSAGSALASPGKAGSWSGSWGASPVFPVGQEISNQTIRQFVRLSGGGTRIRVRFTNETGQEPLVIGAAHVALAAGGGAIKRETDHKLTFGGQDSIIVPAGAPVLSDPVDMAVEDLATLGISIFVPRWTGPAVVHPLAVQTGYISSTGDFTADEKLASPSETKFRFFLSGVDVLSQGKATTIVAFGDSITDGYGATVDADKRWPDRLAERLIERRRGATDGRTFSVVNAGISGNRLLHDRPPAMFGPNALSRFDRDVLAVPGVTHVILLEGINDIGQPTSMSLDEQAVTIEQLQAAWCQLLERAHSRGVKLIAATLLPYEGTSFAGYWTPAGESQRQAFNTWVRQANIFDGVIDFDQVVRDPARPSHLRSALDCGDHLHPNDAGYKTMADSIDLKLFD
ncbi:MAG: SGNH/GDSL hydrolase family protein [Cyanobacteria bacterium SZAS LIN-3]|nr:SGNH/GDSL hydrolase family protein [Cyanobacteria bacterium SZAS LIN-3]